MKIRIPNKLRSILLTMSFLTALSVTAQNIEVKGTVKSGEDKSSIPGVNVIIKGTTTGTITDLDGKFLLNVEVGSVLVFSYIGYLTEEYTIGPGQINIDIMLTPDLVDVDEVIVVGYGTQKKADLTSSIAVLSPKELIKMPGGITEGLQGAVAGVNVSRNIIRIRGVGSLGNTDPLWVVDGLIGGSAPNENEIESIQILKDAASCAIYGSRGANGVIIVTTKKGKKGEPKVEYHGYTGTKYPWKTLDMMNAKSFAEYANEAYYNYYGNTENTPPAYLDPNNMLADSDWQDEWFRKGWYQNHNVSVSGGNESVTYRTGLNYNEDQSTVIRGNSENVQMFLNSTIDKGRFKVGQSFVISNYTNEYGGGNFSELLRTPSNLPVYDENEPYGYYITGTAETGNDMINQIGMKNFQDRAEENTNIKGTVFADVEIIKGLNYKFNTGVDIYRGYRYNYDYVYDLGKGKNEDADLSEISQRNNRYMFENTLTYNKKIEDHDITAMAGVTSETSKWRDMQAGGQGFLATGLRTLSNVLYEPLVAGEERESSLYSLLGRVNYGYKEKYLFTVNVRRDASSRFSKDNRWGTFPSASAGWRVSEEPFMESIVWINNLKIRGSYGQIGNQVTIGDYKYESFVTSENQFYTFGSGQENAPAPLPKLFGNPSAKWETTTMTNLGVDVSFFNDKLSFIVEWYTKNTEDLLVEVAIPSSAGSTESPVLNAGELRNSGFEFSATNRNTYGDFSYSVTGNFALNHNEIMSLGTNDDPISGGQVSGGEYVTRTAVGSSIGRFYALKTDGIFKTQDEVNNYVWVNEDGEEVLIQPNASAGDIKFRDLNNDGKINDSDKDWVGSPLPVVTYGLNVSVDYKGFDFSMFWQGEYGQMIFNNGIALYAHGTSAVNQTTKLEDRFRAEDLTITNYDAEGNVISTLFYPKNTDTDVPRAVMSDPNGNFSKMSDYFVEDGSYLRLKRITLGYTLPDNMMDKLNIDKLRVYVGAKNLFTITSYSNFDPEVAGLNDGTNYNLTRGIDMQQGWASSNLSTREFFVGLQLNF